MDAAHKSTLYREVNVTTEAMLAQFEADDPGQFLCECQDVGCSRRLALRRSDYEVVRSTGGYLVSLDCIGDSEVVQRADGYAAVVFRSATGGATTPSTSGPSRSGSSPQESSAAARSRPAWSQPASAQSAAARRAALRLVSKAEQQLQGPPQAARSAAALSSRLWHRQSQSGRLLARPAALPPPPDLRPVS